jgi:uncharacterized protein YodC (DUF2158 family)
MNIFNIGDVVVLKSGGPRMTVHNIGDYTASGFNPGVLCVWFTNNGTVKEESVFHPDALKPYVAPGPLRVTRA